MNFRKTIAGISALTIVSGALPFAQAAAFAAETEKTFTEGTIDAYVYSSEDKSEMGCRFYSDMPSVPYVKLSDYYKNWSGDELSITGKDGKYTLKNAVGASGEIDVNKDTLTAAEYSTFTLPIPELSEDSSLTKMFVQDSSKEIEVSGSPKIITIDFSNYDIDLYGDENDIWFPLPTLCNVFRGNILRSIYYAGSLFFVNDYEEFNANAVISTVGPETMKQNIASERPADLAAYNYNELCRVFDCEYGYPGRIPLNDVMAEKGLDGLLSETNADTKKLKENLLSSDYMTYLLGLFELETYFWDGGHTVTTGFANLLPEENIAALIASYNAEAGDDGVFEGAADRFGNLVSTDASYSGAKAARSAVTGEKPDGEEDSFYRYVEQGDTALFSFDSFMSCDLPGWNAYYTGEGERPNDIVSALYDCVVKADKNPKIKNFVIDVSTNGGGLVPVNYYIISLISGNDTFYDSLVKYGVTTKAYYETDRNLDGKFDSKDVELKFDLNFGIIESEYSFSCANTLPVMAKDNGLLIIGEQSGGGACTVIEYYTPDGAPINISSANSRTMTKDGKNVDSGVVPDYNLVYASTDEETGAVTKDFSTVFDLGEVSKCFARYYNTSSLAYMLGDPNDDNNIDAKDATFVLSAYATLATGGALADEDKLASDVDRNGMVDSKDATAILSYYSYKATGGKDDIITFLDPQKETAAK